MYNIRFIAKLLTEDPDIFNSKTYVLMLESEPHEILGIGKTASRDEIQRAFRHKALQNHPDKGGDPQVMSLIIHAKNAMLGDRESLRQFRFNDPDDEVNSIEEPEFEEFEIGQEPNTITVVAGVVPRNHNRMMVYDLYPKHEHTDEHTLQEIYETFKFPNDFATDKAKGNFIKLLYKYHRNLLLKVIRTNSEIANIAIEILDLENQDFNLLYAIYQTATPIDLAYYDRTRWEWGLVKKIIEHPNITERVLDEIYEKIIDVIPDLWYQLKGILKSVLSHPKLGDSTKEKAIKTIGKWGRGFWGDRLEYLYPAMKSNFSDSQIAALSNIMKKNKRKDWRAKKPKKGGRKDRKRDRKKS